MARSAHPPTEGSRASGLRTRCVPAPARHLASFSGGHFTVEAQRRKHIAAISVLGNDVVKVEYKGARVVTCGQIEDLHKKADGQARKQFNDHRHRFVEGVDFFKINASEFRTRFPSLIGSRGGTTLKLFTERGYGKINPL